MPFVLVTVGLIMIVSGARDTHVQLASQLRKDFIPFGNWVLAIGSVGALGYIPELRRFSHYFMALIIIGMVLSNKGFFAKLSQAVKLGPQSPASASSTGTPASSPSTGGASAGTGGAASGPDTRPAFPSVMGSSAGPGYLNNPDLQARFNALMNAGTKWLFGG